MARTKKSTKTFIIVVYLLIAISCLVWLAAYTFYFRQAPGKQGADASFMDLTQSLPPEDTAAGKPPETSNSSAGAAAPENPAAAGKGSSAAGQKTRPAPASGVLRAVPPLPNPFVQKQKDSKPQNRRKPSSPAAITPRPPAKGKIAIILDDAGYQNALLKTFLDFPGKLTISVLPGLPGSAEAARMTRAARREMMLHLPLEPQHGENPGPDAILVSMTAAQIRRLAQKHIDSLPGIAGINNHMGSAATEDGRVMRVVLDLLKERGLYFIDSRTTAGSTGPAIARELALRCRERTVFLDNEEDEAFIRKYFEAGKAAAVKQGWAIMIGHIWCAELARLLPELYAAARAEGFEFVFASELFTEAGK